MSMSDKRPELSLCMIVKATDSEADLLDVALANVSPHVDEICITITGKNKKVEDVAKKFKAKVSHFKWIDDFSAARNFNFKQATGKWIVWIDADDTLQGSENLKPLVRYGEQNNIEGYWFEYHYNFDANGNCIDVHYKAQLLKNNGHFEWKGAIHEDAIQQRPARWVKTNDVLRIHHGTVERGKESHERNIKILLSEVKKNPDEPRTHFYLGRAYIAVNEKQKAIDHLMIYLGLSGWDQERYEARLLIGQALVDNKQYDEALKHYNEAILEREDYPDAYIYKGFCYLTKEEYKKAYVNFNLAGQQAIPDGSTFFNPLLYRRDLYWGMAYSALHLGKLELSVKAIQTALKADPQNKKLKVLSETIAHVLEKHNAAKAYVNVAKYIKGRDERLILPLLSSVPNELSDDPLILNMRFNYTKPEKWPKKSIAVYAGMSAETWTPDNMDAGGIGGSETAIIEITRRLAKKGWDITVFSMCDAPPEGLEFDGVKYKNYWQFNWQDEFDTLWVWRLPELFDLKIKARYALLDLHDVMNPLDFTEERLSRIDKIFVKTKYHRSLLPDISDDKFVIIGNGIDMGRFEGKTEKDPYRFIYSSTPNRGLDILLGGIWQKIKAKFPKATLHLYYGWNTFYKLEKNNPERMAWMKKMQKLVEETDGVVDHGRVGQKELAKDQKKTSFWLYPTYFPEIHCCVGDTLINMPRNHKENIDGVPIKELVGKRDFPVYSYDKKEDRLVLGTVKWVKKTRENAEIWELELDDGSILRATSDHKIMLRDGSYVELKDLSAGDSLMPVYQRANFMIKQNNGKWLDEHRLVGEWKERRNLKSTEHVNHLDDTRYDNRPEMLEVLSANEHHSKTHKGTHPSKRSVEKRQKSWRAWSETTEGKKALSKRGTNRANKFWQVVFPSWTEKKQKEFLAKRVHTRLYNHKVVGVRNTGEKEDVYDMEVEKYHNFGANGIIIHNCITACEMQAAGVIPITSGYAALEETQQSGIKLEGDVRDPKWQDEFAKQVISVVSDSAKVKKMKQEALLASPDFSWDNVVEKWQKELK